MKSTAQAILKRIRVHGRGWIFTPKEFVDLGNRGAVGLTLWRLTRGGKSADSIVGCTIIQEFIRS